MILVSVALGNGKTNSNKLPHDKKMDMNLKVSDILEQEFEQYILDGRFLAGEKIPSERELAKYFDVSRASIREAIQKLETKKLLIKKQGEGTFISDKLWSPLNEPLFELLSSNPTSQMDLLESRYALEGMMSYYAAERGNDLDFEIIKNNYKEICDFQNKGNIEDESRAVMQYLISVTKAAKNVVLLQIINSLRPLLEKNILKNFEMLEQDFSLKLTVNYHREMVLNAICSRKPNEARDAAHAHLSFIKKILTNQV